MALRLCAVGVLACGLGLLGCARNSAPAAKVSPPSPSSASEAPANESALEVSQQQEQPDAEANVAVAAPAPSSQPPVDQAGCVRDFVAHAAGLALAESSKLIAEGLGRTPQTSDLTHPKCATVNAVADLDADGAPDHDVSLCLPPGGHVWDHYLYFSNKGCPRFAARLVAAELTPLAKSHRSIVDLETRGGNGCAGNDFTWTKWRWDGSSYRVADTATCSLCEDPGAPKPAPNANSHPYCKAEIARRKAQIP